MAKNLEKAKMYQAQIDDHGRIVMSPQLRRTMKVKPGDVLYVINEGGEFKVITMAEMVDALADDAVKQSRAGKTIGHDDLLKELGLN